MDLILSYFALKAGGRPQQPECKVLLLIYCFKFNENETMNLFSTYMSLLKLIVRILIIL